MRFTSSPAQRMRFPLSRSTFGLAWGCVLCVLCSSPVEARRFALVVGNNLGGPDLDTLSYAQTDALHMAESLKDLAGFAAEDMQVVTPCDSATLDQAFASMQRKMSKSGNLDAMFLFYYSGHSDRDGLQLGSVHYSLQRLREHFQAMPGQIRIGIFDACQSGAMTRFKGGKATRPIDFANMKNIQGQVIIASSADDELSQESDNLRSSIFTHHWINGIRGSADASGDRKVTLAEAYQYAYQMTILTTSRTRHGIQHPAYQFRIQGEGDIIMADLNLSHSGIGFGAPVAGKYLILDRDRGQIVADFYKAFGNPAVIDLPAGAYQVIKVDRAGWMIADEEITKDRVMAFDSRDLAARANVVNLIKGRLDTTYKVSEGPLSAKPPSLGATRKYGLSLKIGESAGLLGLAMLYNLGPELQFNGGGGFSTSDSYQDSSIQTGTEIGGNFFGLIRQYDGPYFVDAGLNLKTNYLSVSDSSGSGSDYGWEMGIPVHVGIELGPRQSFFASLSLGYLWVFTGGGDVVKARTPAGKIGYERTVESGMSLGIAVGMYLF